MRPADRCEDAPLFGPGDVEISFRDANDDTQQWGAQCSLIEGNGEDVFFRVEIPPSHRARIGSYDFDPVIRFFRSCDTIVETCLASDTLYNDGDEPMIWYVGVEIGQDEHISLYIEIRPCGENCAPPECGNGVLEPGEECDDGNFQSSDGCDPFCAAEKNWTDCGDGITEGPEGCDDGARISGDGCSSDCEVEAPSRAELCAAAPLLTSGTNRIRVATGVDHFTEYLGCPDLQGRMGDSVYRLELAAGTFVKMRTFPDFMLDQTSWVFATDCEPIRPSCSTSGLGLLEYYAPAATTLYVIPEWATARTSVEIEIEMRQVVCGDGYADAYETCDDAGTLPGDGCSDTCTEEQGYQCYGDPSTCLTGGDSCADSVLLEEGFYHHGVDGMNADFSTPPSCAQFGGVPDRAYHVEIPPGEEARFLMLRAPDAPLATLALAPSCTEVLMDCQPRLIEETFTSRRIHQNTSTVTETLHVFVGNTDEYRLGVQIARRPDLCVDAPLVATGTHAIDTSGLRGFEDIYPGCTYFAVGTGPEWSGRIVVPSGQRVRASFQPNASTLASPLITISTDCADAGGSCVAYDDSVAEYRNGNTQAEAVVITVGASGVNLAAISGVLTLELWP